MKIRILVLYQLIKKIFVIETPYKFANSDYIKIKKVNLFNVELKKLQSVTFFS